MKPQRKQAAIVLGLVTAAGIFTAGKARAQFLGGIVHDPINWGVMSNIWKEDISTGAKLVKEFNEMVKIYTVGVQTYNQAVMMAQAVRSPQRGQWMTALQLGANDYTRNVYGETATWPMMANGHPELAANAWATATVQVPQLPTSPTDPRLMNGLLSRVASMEIADGSSTKCLQTVAQYRQNEQANLGAVNALQFARLSDSAALNTHAAQANLLNAGSAQSLNEMRAQGALETCLVEQQVITNKAERDAVAKDLSYQAHAQAVLSSAPNDWDGESAAGTFRLP